MSTECSITTPDTPATRFRNAIESSGFTIEGLPDAATEAQVLAAAEALVQQIQHYRDTHTPAGVGALMLLIGMGAEGLDLDKPVTLADARDAAMALGRSMAAKS